MKEIVFLQKIHIQPHILQYGLDHMVCAVRAYAYKGNLRQVRLLSLSGRRLPAGSQRGLVIENGKVVFKK